jgi:hypothetical protein
VGQDAVFTYAAEDLFWIGTKRGLIKAEQSYEFTPVQGVQNSGELVILPIGLATKFIYSRTADIVRADKQMGCFVSGTV